MQNNLATNGAECSKDSRFIAVDLSDPTKPSVYFTNDNLATTLAYTYGQKPPTHKEEVTTTDDDGGKSSDFLPAEPFLMLILDREAPDLLLCSITS